MEQHLDELQRRGIRLSHQRWACSPPRWTQPRGPWRSTPRKPRALPQVELTLADGQFPFALLAPALWALCCNENNAKPGVQTNARAPAPL